VVPTAGDPADVEGMRRRSVVTALVAATAGLTAAALRRRAARRRAQAVAVVAARPVPMPIPAAVPAAVPDGVVVPFTPRIVRATPAPTAPAPTAPARCGDTGGRTKAGAPCAARATSGGRCHHHRIAV
jgi:hypothetical protein